MISSCSKSCAAALTVNVDTSAACPHSTVPEVASYHLSVEDDYHGLFPFRDFTYLFDRFNRYYGILPTLSIGLFDHFIFLDTRFKGSYYLWEICFRAG
jgi:hypothetical protein